MNYKKVVEQLYQGLGGESNIVNVSHCATRFRVSLSDENKYDEKLIESIEGVKGAIKVGSQYQIIFGPEVESVYSEFVKTYGGTTKGNVDKKDKSEGFSFKRIVADVGTYIQGAVGFVIIPLTGCGMLKALLIILSSLGVLSSSSDTYTLLFAASDAVMYFLPVMLAVGAAKRLGCSEGMAMILALMTFYPTYTAALASGTTMNLFGLQVPEFSFAQQFLPALMSVAIYAQLEKFFKKHVPSILVNIISPLVSLIIMTPIIFIVIAQIFIWFNTAIAVPATWIAQYRILVMPILAVLWPLLTIFGLHGAVYQTVYLVYFTVYNYDPVAITSYLATHMAIGTTALVSGIRAKDDETKEIGISSAITMLFGSISEPAIFGVLLKNKNLFKAEMCAAGVGALAAALFGIKNYIVGNSASLLGLAGYVGPESSLFGVIMTVVITMASAVFFCFLFDKPSKSKEA